MTNNPHDSNTNIQHPNCMSRRCNNAALYDIKLDLVKRSGYFCDNCKKYFEERDLIISCSTIALGVGEGKFESVEDEEKTIA